MTVVRKVATGVSAGVAAGLVGGLVAGLVARLMMRLATLAGGGEAGFSLGGTVAILILFVAAAVPGAVLAALRSGRGRSALLVVGALLLCVPATAVAGTDLAHLTGLSTLQWAGVVLATAGVYAAILTMPWVTLRFLALGGRRATARRSLAVTAPQH